ncbi:molecular chaperone [Histoplasma capsulatum H143]|uniref:Molecular chaperone n=1 Tax=Ajellomyces capsulatus (strain H143) TaxID=544712 RepID=C6HHW3_AJECH|nr:molecular chaperone [Histoplasma capsulatum H143]
MSRRRLLDVLLLLNASRGVAGRHISHQQRQLDLHIRTSSLTKEANAQLDHIILALQAASELSRKFDNSRLQHSGETVSNERGDIGGSRHEQNDENFSVKKGETEFDREADINQGIESTSGDELPRETLSTQNPAGGAGDVLNAVPEGPRRPIELAGSHTPPMPAEDGFVGADLANSTVNLQQAESQDIRGKTPATPAYKMVESRVPSTRLGRLWEYGGLATSMAFGIVGQSIRRATVGLDSSSGSLIFSPENVERLVSKLSKMRGAALKLGQLMSFQDAKMLPPAIHEILQRVQDQANYMPAKQRDSVLVNNLGENWRDLFDTFDELPIAAASIGQVHRAVLKETGKPVAVKIQYPGVADSIDSDLSNLSILLTASHLLPNGLFLDKTIANARTELAWECNYIREAECGERFRTLLKDDTATFMVPEIIYPASGKQVLTMEYLEGIPVTRVQNFTQAQRDWIGTQILRLSLREICEFRFMQTDPNWTNFLYNASTNKLELLDFGASRDYPGSFISTYLRVLQAASRNDRETCRDLSIKLGYLTGFESQAMVNAHITSILTLSEPFMASSPDVYDFSDQTITDRVREMIPLMLRERLAPPPEETYSLHRKLSGAFLLCARLGSRVRCKELFENALKKVEWVDGDEVFVGDGEELVDGLRRRTVAG